jgi:integrase/recombinase XerC
MQAAVTRFLRFLSVERNASPLTIKSYREDLAALVDYLQQAYGRLPSPGEITPLDLRGYRGRIGSCRIFSPRTKSASY